MNLNDLVAKAATNELVGVFNNVEEEAYHNGPGLSRSDLNSAAKSAKHFFEKQPMKRTPALVFGSAFHTLILEPELFDKRFEVVEKIDRRKKEIKELLEVAEKEGFDLITKDDYEKLQAMRDSLFKNPYVKSIFEEGKPEQTAYAIDEKTGLLTKARADWVVGRTLVDLKTTGDASMQEFRKSMVKYSYDLQTAHYLKTFSKASGKEYNEFIFICVEKEAPYGVAAYLADDSVLETGEQIRSTLIKRIATAKENEDFETSYPQEIRPINLAAYGYDVESRIGESSCDSF